LLQVQFFVSSNVFPWLVAFQVWQGAACVQLKGFTALDVRLSNPCFEADQSSGHSPMGMVHDTPLTCNQPSAAFCNALLQNCIVTYIVYNDQMLQLIIPNQLYSTCYLSKVIRLKTSVSSTGLDTLLAVHTWGFVCGQGIAVMLCSTVEHELYVLIVTPKDNNKTFAANRP